MKFIADYLAERTGHVIANVHLELRQSSRIIRDCNDPKTAKPLAIHGMLEIQIQFESDTGELPTEINCLILKTRSMQVTNSPFREGASLPYVYTYACLYGPETVELFRHALGFTVPWVPR